jgi:two-component system OmpR family sensor kinase/two-component system sensor histidine kinase QseC
MKSLRARLLISLLTLVGVAALVVGGVTYRNVLRETEALFDYQLRQMALSLRDQGAISADEAAAFGDDELDFLVQIWATDGRHIYVSRAGRAGSLPPRAVLGFANAQVDGATWRVFSVATRDRVIQVAQPLSVRRGLAAAAALRSALPLLLLAPILGAAIWWLVGTTLQPLRRVAADVKQRSADALAPLPDAGLPDEVSPLVRALNRLLARLQKAFDTQRAFVADAAHELRSPLTALKLQLELLRRAPDEAARRGAIDALGAGIERATHLVEQLLTLARNEPGAQPAPVERVAFAETVRQAVADVVPFAASRGIELALDAHATPTVDGNASALRVLVRNLVDNAARYAPADTRVEVVVAENNGAPLLRVDDRGPGIPQSERSRVFDRFYRRNAENKADLPSGSGLGLAIVKSIAERSGAQIELTDSPLGGLRVTVRFPAARATRSV